MFKQKSILLFFLVLFCNNIIAQKPMIICQKSMHNFGIIKEKDGIVTHVFTIKNVGKAPLVIQNADASCGCTKPSYTKKPIPPGKTGEVKVEFDLKNQKGNFSKTIFIYSNATKKPLLLRIIGEVK